MLSLFSPLPRRVVLFVLLMVSASSWANCPPARHPAVTCEVLSSPPPGSRSSSGPPRVFYFFKYSCRTCAKATEFVNEWEKKGRVTIDRVYANWGKADRLNEHHYKQWYYAFRTLGVEQQLTPKLFDSVAKRGYERPEDLIDALVSFALSNGLTRADLRSALDSPATKDALQYSESVTKSHDIDWIPSITFNGRYRVRWKSSEQEAIEALGLLLEELTRQEGAGR